MARTKLKSQSIDNSSPAVYLQGRVKDNTGAGDGTPVNEFVYGDMHQVFAKLMDLYKIKYNDLPDNEVNGYQLIEALIALASKNDFVLPLTSSGGALNISLKINSLKTNEAFVCQAVVDMGEETTIKGSLDNSEKAVVVPSAFKTGEYVRLINRADSVEVIRLIDPSNFGTIADILKYLKAATQAVEDAGTSEAVATTPKTNKAAFAKRVTGSGSSDYLAGAANNGLLSKEQWAIINGIGNARLRNSGYFGGLDVKGGQVNSTYTVGGDIESAKKTSTLGDGDVIEVTFKNAMDSSNYKLQVSVESQGNFTHDNDFKPVVWKIKSTTKAEIYIEETNSVSQNIKIHIDVIQL